MKQQLTQGIILRRTDYGEADRIITLLTPDYGKLTLLAKGVRKVKSKLAGGIELFSVSHITFIQGRGEVGTLVSTRLEKHYKNIVTDLNRTMLGYEIIKHLNSVTEDNPEAEYFNLLQDSFTALDDDQISSDLIRLWFDAQLLRLAGHSPNLKTDTNHHKLSADQQYNFDHDAMAFMPHPSGIYKTDEIKFLRLVFSGNSPVVLQKITASGELVKNTHNAVKVMSEQFLRSRL